MVKFLKIIFIFIHSNSSFQGENVFVIILLYFHKEAVVYMILM